MPAFVSGAIVPVALSPTVPVEAGGGPSRSFSEAAQSFCQSVLSQPPFPFRWRNDLPICPFSDETIELRVAFQDQYRTNSSPYADCSGCKRAQDCRPNLALRAGGL